MTILYEGKNAGKNVRVHYTGTLDDGSKFDSSLDRNEPLSFVAGVGMMIPGFDRAIVDMEVGERRSIHLEPADAYGEYNKDMVIVSKYSDLPGSENLEIGQNVMLMNEMGMRFPVTVTAKDDDSITLDGNHRLAGKALNFDIVLVDVAE
jgi:FKBP-type peptidyl-prolyl cis-trans isomerase 2